MTHKRKSPPTKINISLGALARCYDEPCPGDPDTMVTITATWTVDYWTQDGNDANLDIDGWAPGDFGMASDVEAASITEREEREKAAFWARHPTLRDARGGR